MTTETDRLLLEGRAMLLVAVITGEAVNAIIRALTPLRPTMLWDKAAMAAGTIIAMAIPPVPAAKAANLQAAEEMVRAVSEGIIVIQPRQAAKITALRVPEETAKAKGQVKVVLEDIIAILPRLVMVRAVSEGITAMVIPPVSVATVMEILPGIVTETPLRLVAKANGLPEQEETAVGSEGTAMATLLRQASAVSAGIGIGILPWPVAVDLLPGIKSSADITVTA